MRVLAGANNCRRCTYPEARQGYCEACTGYLCGVVAENLAHYAGFTEAEWRDYAEDSYSMSAPPVLHCIVGPRVVDGAHLRAEELAPCAS